MEYLNKGLTFIPTPNLRFPLQDLKVGQNGKLLKGAFNGSPTTKNGDSAQFSPQPGLQLDWKFTTRFILK